ncbi:hypothetical protein HK103_006767 [Boothiomyces macroporosus]|uniref:RanBD1 domain-containing protein n=1 Tax=Boothiomyces macroporosus TaxID=261099 RepID=A0AAD5UGC0_9FUNG|nr:hypothetical protein HK103_006767 [Boothiomyces macroporosus]
MGKRDAEHQLDSYNWQADDNEDGPQDFQRASEREISKRQIKPLRKGVRKGGAASARSNPYANTFKSVEPTTDTSTGLFGIPSANTSAPVAPNLFAQNSSVLASKQDNSSEIKSLADKIVGLNKSFLKQISENVASASNVDLTVLCNEYIKFRKEIAFKISTMSGEGSEKEKSPVKQFAFGTPATNGKPLFGVGAKPDSAKEVDAPKLSFVPPTSTNAPTDKPLFSFGGPKSDAAPAQPLTFQIPTKEGSTEKPAFSFGTSKPENTLGKSVDVSEKDNAANKSPVAQKTSSNADKPAFSFTGNTMEKSGDVGEKDDGTKKPLFAPIAPVASSNKPLFTFGATKTDSNADKPAFSFTAPKSDEKSADKPMFSFGAKTTPAPGFSFGTPKSDIATPTPAPKGDAPSSAFTFGAKETTSAPAFSFTAPKTETAKPAFSFGAPTDTTKTPFSFGTPSATASNPPAFSFAPPKSDDKPVSLVANMGDPKPLNSTFQFSKPEEATEEGDAMPELAQVGDSLMQGEGEENEKSIHEQKAKIFVQITNDDGKKDWNAIGVGILKVKETRLLCRAENSGRVLLNARLYKAMKLTKVGDKQFTTIMMHEEQMKPVLIRCGKVDETDKLIEIIQETAKSN